MNSLRLPAPLQAMLFASMGALSAALLVQMWSVAGEADQPVIWWAGRASGFLAYGALWLAMLFGLAVSSKGAGGLLPKKMMMDLHQQWTLSAVIATVVHVLTLVFHAESGVTPWAAVVPFASARLTGPVALGTFALFGLAILVGSSWLRRHLPYSAWRAVHGLAFGTMVLALAHGWTAGTDAASAPVQWLYIVTLAVLLGAMVTRIGLALAGRRRSVRPDTSAA
jgi:methionine sulfoxide reductase heme-binding subunit